jgi:hypothetical protein
MSTNTIAPTIVRVPPWSATGNATARPDSCPAMHPRLHASSKRSITAAHSKLVTQSGAQNHIVLPPQRLHPTRRGATKSP